MLLSVSLVLLFIHFQIQPFIDAWVRFGYVRYSVARTAPVHRIAPEPVTDYAWWWHELTHLTHALIHDPSGNHMHVIGNAVLILVAAWTLLRLLTLLDQRRLFPFSTGKSPSSLRSLARSHSTCSGRLRMATAHRLSASLFSGLSYPAVSSSSLATDGRGSLLRPVLLGCSGPLVTTRSGRAPWCVMLVVVAIVVADISTGSPAMPVHQAGVRFGALVGAVLIPTFVRLPVT